MRPPRAPARRRSAMARREDSCYQRTGSAVTEARSASHGAGGRRSRGRSSMDLLDALSAQAAFINSRVIPWVLRLVMIGLGLSLTLEDFKRVIVFPKAATIGLVAQLVRLPLVAFLPAFPFGPAAAIAVGLVIVAACPSGVTSNAYSFAARADVPLCVTLSAVTSVVTVFTIPFLIDIAMKTFANETQAVTLPVFGMLRDLIGYTLVPLALGMMIRGVFTSFAEKAIEPIRKSVLWLMVAVLLLGVVSSYREVIDHFAAAGGLVLAMNVLTMALGFGLGKAFRL